MLCVKVSRQLAGACAEWALGIEPTPSGSEASTSWLTPTPLHHCIFLSVPGDPRSSSLPTPPVSRATDTAIIQQLGISFIITLSILIN